MKAFCYFKVQLFMVMSARVPTIPLQFTFENDSHANLLAIMVHRL